MTTLQGKTVFISGATRGIGKAIALKCAADGANIVVTGKTDTPHPKLPGTLQETVQECEAAGGKALGIQMDVREDDQIADAVQKAVNHFGGIDILINNASAISLTPAEQTPMKRVDLMWNINMRGTYALSVACLEALKVSPNAHIMAMSPPPSLDPKWFKNHTAYTISKFGMSFAMMGLAEEFKKYNISVNALWPKTIIGTAALSVLGPLAPMSRARKPEIVADAVYAHLTTPEKVTGQFLIDEDVLRKAGVTNFDHYAIEPGQQLVPDLFIEQDRKNTAA